MITWSWLGAIWMMLVAIYLNMSPGTQSAARWMFGVSILSFSFHMIICLLDIIRGWKSV